MVCILTAETIFFPNCTFAFTRKGNIFFLWPWTLSYDLDLVVVKLNHHVKYLGVRIITFEKDCNRWRSSGLPLFSRLYITSYWWSEVTTTPSYTVSEILPHLQCRPVRLLVILRSPLVWKRQLKLQSTCTFQFMSKRIVVNTYDTSRDIGARKVSRVLNSKSDLQVQDHRVKVCDNSRSLALLRHTISC